MGYFDYFTKGNKPEPVQQKAFTPSRPSTMVFRFLPSGQVVWYDSQAKTYLDEGFLKNHAVFTVLDWKAAKIATVPPIVYEVKDEALQKKRLNWLRDPTPDSVNRARDIQHKALEEIEGHEIGRLLERPNPMMGWQEFAYGSIVFKELVGSSYWAGTRTGIMDPTTGKIKEMWLLPAHDVRIVSGGMTDPISAYYLSTNPEVKISAANVCQIRHFSPDYSNGIQWMYGMSRLQALMPIVQKSNDANAAEVSLFQNHGIRDIVFPKAAGMNEFSPPTSTDTQKLQDTLDQMFTESEVGGVLANSVELGSIRVGMTPADMGVLESQSITKLDICAAFRTRPELFGWGENSTFNNVAEARKASVTDAVIPELMNFREAINRWVVPSYAAGNKRLTVDFDLESIPEMAVDNETRVKTLMSTNAVSTNEIRAVLNFDRYEGNDSADPADRILVKSGHVFIEDVGIGSFAVDPEAEDEENTETN